MGILCRHILTTFQAKNILQIPNQYILHRWTKEANIYMEVTNMESHNDEVDTLRSLHVHNILANFQILLNNQNKRMSLLW